MNENLKTIQAFLENNGTAPPEERTALLKAIKNIADELNILAFKLDRTEKVKRTTGILLEETIDELEKKNRQVRIEAALERVRGRTMAMQKSDELAHTAVLLFQQFSKLVNLPANSRSHISIVDEERNGVDVWMTFSNGQFRAGSHFVEFMDHPLVQKVYQAWKNKQPYVVRDLSGKELEQFTSFLATFTHVNSDNGLKEIVENPPERLVYTDATFAQGLLGIMTYVPLTEAALNILTRFAKVFEQTYTRFLDLKNAEEQNKIIQAENDRKTQELEEARQLQLAMLPKEFPRVPGLKIAAHMQTATEVGGDYYDFHLAKDGTLTAVIGDATGHGLKAGTMVTITKSLFNSLAANEDILDTFRRISGVIRGMSFRRLSMCLMMLKLKGNKLSVASAAMPPALIYRRKANTVEEIFSGGMPLGTMTNFPYSLQENFLENGDTLLMLSDGLPELKNERDEMFGYNRMKSTLRAVGKEKPEKIIDHFKNTAAGWAGANVPDDDITFLVIRKTGLRPGAQV